MATQKIKIVVLDTHDVKSINVADASTYVTNPPVVTSPTFLATPPGFPVISIPFNVGGNNILTSDELGITPEGIVNPLPDGIYQFSYSVAPALNNTDTISIMRVDKLMEKFDSVFMGLDLMECDQEIKTQAKTQLNSIYLLIQGSIAAGNNCATTEAYKLYAKAESMLNAMTHNNCGCTGNNSNLYYH